MENFSLAAGVVLLVRLLVPLSIFRWNVAGGFAAMIIADGFDVIVLDTVSALIQQPPSFGFEYQFFDKWLDTYYLSFEAIVSLRWARAARNTSLALFAFRLVGLVAYEITGFRKLFFFFPNLFELFYLYYATAKRFVPKFVPRTPSQIMIVLGLLLIPKLAQEWILHFALWSPWEWFKHQFNVLR